MLVELVKLYLLFRPYIVILTFLLVSSCQCALAQVKETNGLLVNDVSRFLNDTTSQIEKVRGIRTTGLKSVDLSETAGTLYTINREEIDASGAGDLFEILQLVPGISFGSDVDQVVGAGVRGIWANEGKFQVLYNGLPMNEVDFGTCAMSQRLLLDNIDHIDILVSSGPVSMGGVATIGAVNLVSYLPGVHDGSTLSSGIGVTTEGIARLNVSASGNHYLGNETFGSYYIGMIGGAKSTYQRSDNQNDFVNYKDSTQVLTNEVHFSVRRKNLSAQFFSSDYTFDVAGQSYKVNMRNTVAEIQLRQRIGTRSFVQFRPALQLQEPWTIQNSADPVLNASNTRATSGWLETLFSTEPTNWLLAQACVQAFSQYSVHELLKTQPGDSSDVDFDHHLKVLGFFINSTVKSGMGNLSVSARGESSNLYSLQLSPQFSYSLVTKKFFIKAGVFTAFKRPTLENIHLGPSDKKMLPEKFIAQEIQLGVTPSEKFSVHLSVFNNKLQNPIVYVYSEPNIDNYINRDHHSTAGFEIMTDIHAGKFFIKPSWSYYLSISDSMALPETWVPGKNVFQAFPAHKVTCISGYKLNSTISIGAAVMFFSRYTWYDLYTEEKYEANFKTEPSTIELSINSVFTLKRASEWQFKIGVNNVLNDTWSIGSPYNNGIEPFPMSGREYRLSISYLLTR